MIGADVSQLTHDRVGLRARAPAPTASNPEEGMMERRTRVTRRPWLRTARTAAPIIATAALALPVAAFGSSPWSNAAGGSSHARGSALSQSTNIQKALAYSRCMRSHGVPKFPDPTSSGASPKVSPQQVGVSNSQLQAAQNHCRYLLPNGGSGPSQTQVQQVMHGMLRFAQCMRSHGLSNWPDPVIDAGGNPEFYLDGKINQNSPQIKSKIGDCLHWLPSFAISPGNPVACPGANPGGGPGCGACSCRRRQ